MGFWSKKKAADKAAALAAEVMRKPDHQIGTWELEINQPYGFVLTNTVDKSEFHFFYTSNGWITTVDKRQKDTQYRTMSSWGITGLTPILASKESCQKYARINALQSKKELTLEESLELLKLTGIRKE